MTGRELLEHLRGLSSDELEREIVWIEPYDEPVVFGITDFELDNLSRKDWDFLEEHDFEKVIRLS